MAAPLVPSYASKAQGTASGTSFSVTMPSGINSGDLLLVFIGEGGNDISATGWTQVLDRDRFECFKRIADGTEGASMTFDSTGGAALGYMAVRIINASGEITAGSNFSTIGGNADHNEIIAENYDDNLIIVAMHEQWIDLTPSPPSNYTLIAHQSTASGAAMHVAYRNVTGLTEDPQGFGYNSSHYHTMLQIAVSPAESRYPTTPILEATNTSSEGSPTTSHTVNLPASISADDLLVMVFNYGDELDEVSTPSGWTLENKGAVGTISHWYLFWKMATGSEGATVAVTSSGSQDSTHVTYRFSQANDLEMSVGSYDTTTIPNSPALSPTWGADTTFWMHLVVGGNNGAVNDFVDGAKGGVVHVPANGYGIYSSYWPFPGASLPSTTQWLLASTGGRVPLSVGIKPSVSSGLAQTVVVDTAGQLFGDSAAVGQRPTFLKESGGRMWAMQHDRTPDDISFFYSNDGGDTWAENTNMKITDAWTSSSSMGFVIDALDRLFVVYHDSAFTTLFRHILVPSATASWSSTTQIAVSNDAMLALTATYEGTDSYVHILWEDDDLNDLNYACRKVTSGGAVSSHASSTVDATATTSIARATIAFHHTGDGITPSSTPHLFAAYFDSDNTTKFVKAAWSSGPTWTWGSTTQIGAANEGVVNSDSSFGFGILHDGADSVWIGGSWYSSTSSSFRLHLHERDVADTTTTNHINRGDDGTLGTSLKQAVLALHKPTKSPCLIGRSTHYGLSSDAVERMWLVQWDGSTDNWYEVAHNISSYFHPIQSAFITDVQWISSEVGADQTVFWSAPSPIPPGYVPGFGLGFGDMFLVSA